MRPPSVRRAAILAVCALGALIVYWIPTSVTTPAVLNLDDERVTATPRPAETTPVTTPDEPSEPETVPVTNEQVRRQPPTSVFNLRLASNTLETFTVAWDAASDQIGVENYQVLLNGFAAALTASTNATLNWPQGDENVLIQVSAVNTRGNQGEWRSLVIIPPPTEPLDPVATQRPPPPLDEQPTESPSPTHSGTEPSVDDPDQRPSDTPSSPESSQTPSSTPTATADGTPKTTTPDATAPSPDPSTPTATATASNPGGSASPLPSSSQRTPDPSVSPEPEASPTASDSVSSPPGQPALVED